MSDVIGTVEFLYRHTMKQDWLHEFSDCYARAAKEFEGAMMTRTFRAIYENGIFRPTETIDLPDPCEVSVEIREIGEPLRKPSLDDVYAILGRRHASGERDLAERHNEHQP